jgi:RNA polymerase subunit RPABC4/transcription elongation factor Spt4
MNNRPRAAKNCKKIATHYTCRTQGPESFANREWNGYD